MKALTVILLLHLAIACTDKPAYTITTFLTEYDSRGKLIAKQQKKSVDAFDADSNLIYTEEYAISYLDEDNSQMQSNLQLQKQNNNEKKNVYTYQYSGKMLLQKKMNDQPFELYEYDRSGKLVKESFVKDCANCYVLRLYNSRGLQTSTRHYLGGRLIQTDTLVYDDQAMLVQTTSFDQSGNFISVEKYTRDADGRLLERKIKKQGIRGDQPLEKYDDPEYYWYIDNFFYDEKGRKTKLQRYDHGVLTHDYIFTYE